MAQGTDGKKAKARNSRDARLWGTGEAKGEKTGGCRGRENEVRHCQHPEKSDVKRLESGPLDRADLSLGVCAKVVPGDGVGAPECRDVGDRRER